MKNHTDVLNLIASKIGAKWYLEIGVYNPDHNFNHIAVERKVSVDPDPAAGALLKLTSDEYFALFPGQTFDLVFIDGLHHADQVKKDIQNGWNCLNVGGVIVLHDCNPPTVETTCVPRGAQREWCGDVYKTICRLSGAQKFTVDFDYGCSVIRKTSKSDVVEFGQAWEYPWNVFEQNRRDWLNLKSVHESMEIINSWT